MRKAIRIATVYIATVYIATVYAGTDKGSEQRLRREKIAR